MNLIWPVGKNAPVTQRFGENPGSYAYECRADRSHNGIDFGVPIGSVVVAAASGAVVMAGADRSGYGTHIRIEHAFGMTIYAHLSALMVVPGQRVSAGEIIGMSGNSGNSTGPHLHFELRMPNGERCQNAVDPEGYLSERHEAVPAEPVAPNAQARDWPGMVTSEVGLNVRSGAGTAFAIRSRLEDGDRLALREIWGKTADGSWVAVFYDGAQLVDLSER